MSNQNTKSNHGINVAFFIRIEEIGLDNFGCGNSPLSLFYLYFVTSLRKKIMAYVRLQLNRHPPHMSQYTFSWTTPASSWRTYFMDDPLLSRLIKNCKFRFRWKLKKKVWMNFIGSYSPVWRFKGFHALFWNCNYIQKFT